MRVYEFKTVCAAILGDKYLVEDTNVVDLENLIIVDAEDEETARSFGLTDVEINFLRAE